MVKLSVFIVQLMSRHVVDENWHPGSFSSGWMGESPVFMRVGLRQVFSSVSLLNNCTEPQAVLRPTWPTPTNVLERLAGSPHVLLTLRWVTLDCQQVPLLRTSDRFLRFLRFLRAFHFSYCGEVILALVDSCCSSLGQSTTTLHSSAGPCHPFTGLFN